jgi:hypothetical protein
MTGHSTEQEHQIKEFLTKGQKVAAVKLYREITGVGLKEAKDAVDAIEAQMRGEIRTSQLSTPAISDDPFAEDKQRNRLFVSLIVAILLIGVLAFFLLQNGGF